MAQIYTSYKGDLNDTNQVCFVSLNGVQLPVDVQISMNGNKIIAQSQILDGVSVFERVSRKPMDIDFDFTMRSQKTTYGRFLKPAINTWIFPIDGINDVFSLIWEKDQVLEVKNLFLEKLGIRQVVVSDIQITTIRGSVDVPIKLKCIEDFYSTKTQGTSLIII
jgi:hypothetical protein